jgi:uncharacterized membrane protein
MLPLIVLTFVTLIAKVAGLALHPNFNTWRNAINVGLIAMFIVTASAHWGKRRKDLVAMVPPFFSNAEFLVTATGVLELAGAIGLTIPQTRGPAAFCLCVLLVFMLPANIHAAQRKLTIDGKPVSSLGVRLSMQIAFLACLLFVSF